MSPEIVQSILREHFDAKLEESTWHVDEDRRLIMLIKHEGGIMQIPRTVELRFEERYVSITTAEARYFVPPSSLFGLKSEDPQLRQSDKRPGFFR